MFRAILDFFSRLRCPSASQLFGNFYASRTTTAALYTFNSTLAELEGVARHHTAQAQAKADQALVLNAEAGDHNAEAQSATVIAGKIKALLT
jgi:hypothetical protein